LIGRREKGKTSFVYRAYPPGTFLGEQFCIGGLVCRNGRILLVLWGARRRGENWQSGVLISDDDGKNWRYQTVGFESDLKIRDDPEMPAGYNEQTLFETRSGKIISIIRGREKLGRLMDSPKDTWFFRSVSLDHGESWSKPELTNLAGTGASMNSVTLPDGSLLMAARIPYSRTLYKLDDKRLFGLHVVRSFDEGKTWKTEFMLQRAPDEVPFARYYDTMNGTFQQVAEREWIYGFAQLTASMMFTAHGNPNFKTTEGARTNNRMLMLRLKVQ
jgi:hypothetical protein